VIVGIEAALLRHPGRVASAQGWFGRCRRRSWRRLCRRIVALRSLRLCELVIRVGIGTGSLGLGVHVLPGREVVGPGFRLGSWFLRGRWSWEIGKLVRG
jgi:hypothetical protein